MKLMTTLMTVLSILVISPTIQAQPLTWDGKLTFWKRTAEANGRVSTLPVQIGNSQPVHFEISDPTSADPVFVRIEITGEKSRADIWAFRIAKPNEPEYTILQIRLFSLAGDLIAECSRYEAPAPRLPVGSCGGRSGTEVLGLTLSY
ncbi:MAG: hypothetical protein V4760_16170 [Bdellovibrionota bacterium]